MCSIMFDCLPRDSAPENPMVTYCNVHCNSPVESYQFAEAVLTFITPHDNIEVIAQLQ